MGIAGMGARPAQSNFRSRQKLSAEFTFLQHRTGQIQTVNWHQTADIGIVETDIAASEMIDSRGLQTNPQDLTNPETPFKPIESAAYCQAIQQILTQTQPKHCYWYFECHGQTQMVELTITPILPLQGPPQIAMVMGRSLGNDALKALQLPPLVTPTPVKESREEERLNVGETQSSPVTLKTPVHLIPSETYQEILMQISRRIRQTLDLTTIGQQTVDGLGQSLGLSRCWLMAYDAVNEQLQVRSEFCQSSVCSHLGSWLDLDSATYWAHTLSSAEPIIVGQIPEGQFAERSVLAIATYYQHQCNGILCLQQCDYPRHWSPTDIQLVQELAERLGAAIAHATLYQELEQATQEAEAASRLKSEFLASTSHELRTPLNGIIGFLKLVIEGMADTPEEQREFLEEAHRSALHLLNLINDILDIAKIEAGKMELELSTVEVDALLADVEKFTRPQALAKHLSFQIESPATLTPMVLHGNYQRLLQVMLNLVGNGIKFTHEGGIFISTEAVIKTIHCHGQTFPGWLEIRVADTGIGVSLEQQDKLFEKFVQVDGSHSKTYGGTGLGLAISQKLIEAMGGQIFFYSMGEGLGSTVTFTVPLNHLPVFKTSEPISSTIELVR